jgi:hypothetical protein
MKDEQIKIPDFNKLQQFIVDYVFTTVKRRTPVDTGQARDGWVKTETTISNDVPYIGVLEYGSSDQAPNGMIRITLEEVPAKITEFLNKETKS